MRILLEWPVFLLPIFVYHLSALAGSKSRYKSIILTSGYLLAAVFYIVNILTDAFSQGGVIKDSVTVMGSEYLRPGPMFVIALAVSLVYLALAGINIKKSSADKASSIGQIVGLSFYSLTLVVVFLSYYQRLSQFCFYSNVGLILFAVLIIYAFLSERSGLSEGGVRLKDYLFKTAAAFIVLGIYTAIFFAFLNLNISNFIFYTVTSFIIFLALSFYNWFSTFANDLFHNINSGISIVTDEEVYYAIRHYNNYERLEESSFSRLKSLRKMGKDKISSLREYIKESIEYFKPDDLTRRTKANLKYKILTMIAYDQAEEGQILWELGFDEYPLRIMGNERSFRPPLYKIEAASDYSYTSRNAYLALKKEAIHDVAWRISYLEKNAG